MATIRRVQDLEIWQLARQQSKEIFYLTKNRKFSNDWELINQIRRSSGSVMDNIAEGFDRYTTKDFAHFLKISRGSNGEVISQYYRAFDREYITNEILESQVKKAELLARKINAFIRYLANTSIKEKSNRKTSIGKNPNQQPLKTDSPKKD